MFFSKNTTSSEIFELNHSSQYYLEDVSDVLNELKNNKKAKTLVLHGTPIDWKDDQGNSYPIIEYIPLQINKIIVKNVTSVYPWVNLNINEICIDAPRCLFYLKNKIFNASHPLETLKINGRKFIKCKNNIQKFQNQFPNLKSIELYDGFGLFFNNNHR